MGKRPKYNQFDKMTYISMCQRYNAAAAKLDTEVDKAKFVKLSLQLHIAKASVPGRWGLSGFVSSCGVGGF